jgi:hypothetical protein
MPLESGRAVPRRRLQGVPVQGTLHREQARARRVGPTRGAPARGAARARARRRPPAARSGAPLTPGCPGRGYRRAGADSRGASPSQERAVTGGGTVGVPSRTASSPTCTPRRARPVPCSYSPDLGSIDIGGHGRPRAKRLRDAALAGPRHRAARRGQAGRGPQTPSQLTSVAHRASESRGRGPRPEAGAGRSPIRLAAAALGARSPQRSGHSPRRYTPFLVRSGAAPGAAQRYASLGAGTDRNGRRPGKKQCRGESPGGSRAPRSATGSASRCGVPTAGGV